MISDFGFPSQAREKSVANDAVPFRAGCVKIDSGMKRSASCRESAGFLSVQHP